jgi:hypothetical protein
MGVIEHPLDALGGRSVFLFMHELPVEKAVFAARVAFDVFRLLRHGIFSVVLKSL